MSSLKRGGQLIILEFNVTAQCLMCSQDKKKSQSNLKARKHGMLSFNMYSFEIICLVTPGSKHHGQCGPQMSGSFSQKYQY